MTEPTNSGFEEGEYVTTNYSTPSASARSAVADPPTHTVTAPAPAPAPSLNDLDIANLAGLKPNTAAPLALTDQDYPTVEESRTKLPIYKRSLFKAAIIASCLGFVVTIVMRMMFPPEATPVATPAPQPSDKPSVTEFVPDPKLGILASKVAIKEQQDGIIAARIAQQAAAREAAAKNSQVVSTRAVPPAAAAPVAAAPIANQTATSQLLTSKRSPQPVPTYQPRRIVRLQPQPRPVPIASPAPQPARIIVQQPTQPRPARMTRIVPQYQQQPTRVAFRPPSVAQPPKVTAKPPVEITRIAPGTILPRVEPPIPPPIALTWEMANDNAVGVWGRSNKVSSAPTAGTAAISNPNTAQAFQSSQNDGSVAPLAAIGQQLRAKTIIPYQVAATSRSQSLAFTLSDPLVDTSGAAILPAGSQILADVSTLDTGLMQIDSAKALINGQTIDIPKQSLILQNASKQPLIAQSQDSGGGNGIGRTIASMGAGALQGLGQNMLQSSTSLIANGMTIQSNTTPNPLGAAIYGGLNPVLAQIQAQNQAATNQPERISRVWLLPSGTEINLVVARPFRL